VCTSNILLHTAMLPITSSQQYYYLDVCRIGGHVDLDWYLDLKREGSAPTGGFGLGFERLIQENNKFSNLITVLHILPLISHLQSFFSLTFSKQKFVISGWLEWRIFGTPFPFTDPLTAASCDDLSSCESFLCYPISHKSSLDFIELYCLARIRAVSCACVITDHLF
jgi:hypothetical protein